MGNSVSHKTEPLYLWLQCIYGYVDLFLWRLRYSLHIVCFLPTIIRDGPKQIVTLEGHFLSFVGAAKTKQLQVFYIRLSGSTLKLQVVGAEMGMPVLCNEII